MERSYSFSKTNRLYGTKAVADLFADGKGHFQFPFKVYWSHKPSMKGFSARMLATVPKSYSKKAVSRNLIRRRIKEAYRLHMHLLTEKPTLSALNVCVQLAFIYVAKEPLEFLLVEKKLKATLLQVASLLEKELKTGLNHEVSSVD
jgi:ribonuclease P protein component